MSLFRHSWRLSLPATLALAAVGLSCTTACLTTAIVSEAKDDAARARQAAATLKARDKLQETLLSSLPASHHATAAAPRLHVTGGPVIFDVGANGDFSTPERVAAFVAAVRQLYSTRDAAVHLRFNLRLHDDASEPPRLVADPEIAYTDDLVAALQRVLPPARAGAYEPQQLVVSVLGETKTIYVTVRGVFTPDARRAFEQALRDAHTRLPQPTPLFARVIEQNPDGRGEKADEIRLGAP